VILIINICLDGLSKLEFAKPIEDIAKRFDVVSITDHYIKIREDDLRKTEKIIICGTALMDFGYLEHIDKFEWLGDFDKPVLGICAGMQVIARIFGNKTIERTKIGRYRVKIINENKLTHHKEFYSYFLSSKDVRTERHFTTLAESENSACIIKHERKEMYGCLFHPEVLNPEIITNFCKNV
jgi:GMP synthase-like glutamine amidotransferase